MYASSDRHPSFNAHTAGQVIAFFASKQKDSKISKLKVIKLAYLADRESIKVQGEPILYDRKFALDHGPINSATLNLIDGNGSTTHLRSFRKYAHRESNDVVKAARQFERDDFDELSDSDLAVLETVWGEHGAKTANQLRNWTHKKK